MTDSAPIQLFITTGQAHWLHADAIASLHCNQGALRVRWSEDALPFECTLYAESAPWQPPQLPAGSLLQLSCRTGSATSVSIAERATTTVTGQLIAGLRTLWARTLPAGASQSA